MNLIWCNSFIKQKKTGIKSGLLLLNDIKAYFNNALLITIFCTSLVPS